MTLRVVRTKDLDSILNMTRHKDIHRGLICIENKNNEKSFLDKTVKCFLLKDEGRNVGICVILDLSSAFSENGIFCLDLGIIKEYRGRRGFKLGKILFKIIFEEEKCKKLYAIINKKNKPSLFYALHYGFKIKGTDRMNYYLEVTKNGIDD